MLINPIFHLTFKKFWLVCTLVALTVFPATSMAHDDSVLEDILDRGVLRVGLSSFSPWAMRSKNGDFIGFEVDVAQSVADDMDVKLEIVPVAWDGIIPALLSKKFDVIIGGMSITPARNLKVNFTSVYDEGGMGVVANRKLAKGMTTKEDFNKSDVIFALRRGTNPVTFIQENLPNAQILQFDDDISALQEVLNGRAVAWVAATPAPHFAVLDHPSDLYLPLDKPLTTNFQAMALRKGDTDALNYFNNWILAKKASGWLQQRHEYWFESQEWKSLVGEK